MNTQNLRLWILKRKRKEKRKETLSMVQWVWTSGNKAHFRTITRVYLGSARLRALWHMSVKAMLLVMPADKRGEVEFRCDKCFPVSQSLAMMRAERIWLSSSSSGRVKVVSAAVIGNDMKPTMDRKQEQREPKHETKKEREKLGRHGGSGGENSGRKLESSAWRKNNRRENLIR
ncbi:hypothetical protein GBA52_017800 [Prunus armeniaca]|nr:hypothetical protein GBA52_017800 [Prunus armeniaca]